MASSFSLTEDPDVIRQYYPYPFKETYNPAYYIGNYSPGKVITADEPEVIRDMHFALVPFFFKELKSSMLNARSSQLLIKPVFKQLMSTHKRCLILADGFYLWQKFGMEKFPFRFVLKDRPVFAIAGLWSAWINPETKERYESFCMVTVPSNPLVSAIRKSMPVILTKENEQRWLSKESGTEELLSVCTSYPEENMLKFLVSKSISDRDINDPDLIKPLNQIPA